ncbi:MAG: reverse transcriptase domain-containing protein [Pyrinomonadaceae bacterium]
MRGEEEHERQYPHPRTPIRRRSVADGGRFEYVGLMSEALSNLLDLDLAWRRAKQDQPKRIFVRHPYEVDLIETDVRSWLQRLSESLRTDAYHPSPLVICEVPKGRGAVRPGGHLAVDDRIVYAGCVGACLPTIHEHLSRNAGFDFSYRLGDDPNQVDWIHGQFEGWTAFRKQSLAKLAEGLPYVIIADITAYYENVDLATLASDLRQIAAPEEAVRMLSQCLNRWVQVSGRGIPQGHSPSDILGKLYLHSVDYNLREMGYCHYRYVDDYRIFCRDLVEAKRALIDLTRLLRNRGLNLQAAKSEIHRADEAQRIIEGITPVIETVRHKFISTIASLFDEEYAAMSMTDFEAMLAASAIEDPNDAPIEIIHETYKTYFIDSAEPKFDKSLFHFLLRRLGRQKDKFAVDHCKGQFEKHPEETSNILDYVEAVEALDEIEEALLSFLESNDSVYPYQNYQILEWLNRVSANPAERFTAFARRTAFDQTAPFYLRAVARQSLGLHGTAADLERLEDLYAPAQGSVEQSEIICALKRMEVNRRNAFLRRAEGDGELNLRATRLARAV